MNFPICVPGLWLCVMSNPLFSSTSFRVHKFLGKTFFLFPLFILKCHRMLKVSVCDLNYGLTSGSVGVLTKRTLADSCTLLTRYVLINLVSVFPGIQLLGMLTVSISGNHTFFVFMFSFCPHHSVGFFLT